VDFLVHIWQIIAGINFSCSAIQVTEREKKWRKERKIIPEVSENKICRLGGFLILLFAYPVLSPDSRRCIVPSEIGKKKETR
jgi:hypothetical protein